MRQLSGAQADLLTIGDDVFIAGGPSVPCMVQAEDKATVIFMHTECQARTFLGHAGMALPGTTLETGSAVADFACTQFGDPVKSGTCCVGVDKKMAYRKTEGADFPPLMKYVFYSMLLLQYGAFIDMFFITAGVAAVVYASAEGLVDFAVPAALKTVLDPTSPVLFGMAEEELRVQVFALIVRRLVLSIALVAPLAQLVLAFAYSVLAVVNKNLVMGKIRNDKPYQMRGWFMAAWLFLFRHNVSLDSLYLWPFSETPVYTLMWRLFGAEVGKDARIARLGPPDFDCFKIGDRALIGNGVALYAHNFGSGALNFKNVVVGKDARIFGYSAILPNTEFADGTVVGAGTMCLPGKYNMGGHLQGNPARSCVRAPGGEFVHDGDNIILSEEVSVDTGDYTPPAPLRQALAETITGCGTAVRARLAGRTHAGGRYERVSREDEEDEGEEGAFLGGGFGDDMDVDIEMGVRAPAAEAAPATRTPEAWRTVVLRGADAAQVQAAAGSKLDQVPAEGNLASLPIKFASASESSACSVSVVARTAPQLHTRLEAAQRGRPSAGVSKLLRAKPRAHGPSKRPAKVALVFGGESHYLDMGRQLFETNPTFRAALTECDRLFMRHANMRILDAIYGGDADKLGEVKMANASAFCIEYGLLQVVTRDWGVRPDAILGYSVGELAAGVASGMVTVEDVAVIFGATDYEGFDRHDQGRMCVVSGPARAELDATLRRTGEAKLVVSAQYTETMFMIAGPIAAVQNAASALEARGHQAQVLSVPFAYHAPVHAVTTKPSATASVWVRPPSTPLVSCATGDLVSTEGQCPATSIGHIFDNATWFYQGVNKLQELGIDVLLDLSLKADLSYYFNMYEADRRSGMAAVSTLRAQGDDAEHMQSALAGLYIEGASVSPHSLNLL